MDRLGKGFSNTMRVVKKLVRKLNAYRSFQEYCFRNFHYLPV